MKAKAIPIGQSAKNAMTMSTSASTQKAANLLQKPAYRGNSRSDKRDVGTETNSGTSPTAFHDSKPAVHTRSSFFKVPSEASF